MREFGTAFGFRMVIKPSNPRPYDMYFQMWRPDVEVSSANISGTGATDLKLMCSSIPSGISRRRRRRRRMLRCWSRACGSFSTRCRVLRSRKKAVRGRVAGAGRADHTNQNGADFSAPFCPDPRRIRVSARPPSACACRHSGAARAARRPGASRPRARRRNSRRRPPPRSA